MSGVLLLELAFEFTALPCGVSSHGFGSFKVWTKCVAVRMIAQWQQAFGIPARTSAGSNRYNPAFYGCG